MKALLSMMSLLFMINFLPAQSVLKADGKTNVTTLMNGVLSPGYDKCIETPECKHKVPHITQQWDNELEEYVFKFSIHVNEDDDKCKKQDRQRLEIKTFKQSPDSLVAFKGDTVIYKWKFKLDGNFQPSSGFTHIHQIKAIGGSEENMPLLTFTLRKKKSGDLFQVRYAPHLDQEDLLSVPLSPFLGNWVTVEETIVYGEARKAFYNLSIKNAINQKSIVAYTNNKIRLWKTDAELLRPKWGIYRSLKDKINLRDEDILFADFYIKKK